MSVRSRGGLYLVEQRIPANAITVSTSPAYTAGDAVGGKLTIPNFARFEGGSGLLQSVTVYDLSAQRPTLELFLFTQDFTASTDNAAFDPTDADLAYLACPPITIVDWKNLNDNAAAGVAKLALPIRLAAGGTSLYGQFRTTDTPTFVGVSDIAAWFGVLQD